MLNPNMTDIKRNIANKITELMEIFPIVAILGSRQVGKTTLARMLYPDWRYIDLERPKDLEQISYDPNFFFEQNPSELIIDEAQTYPTLFQVLRGVIDDKRQQKGRFILTGSSSPELVKHISESLAGRIAIIELGTLKANEIFKQPLSNFYKMFNKPLKKENIINEKANLTKEQIQQAWLRGGYPEPIQYNKDKHFNNWMDSYQDTYINRDVAKLFPRLNKTTFQRFILMLSKLSGTIVNKSDLARALEVNEKSAREYIHIAEGTFVWRSIPSFEKNIVKAVIKMPKGYIRDSGLLHHKLNINSLIELYSNPLVGASFESFIIEEIIKGLNSTSITNWSPYYYRTRNRAEIDLILDGPFGICPIEVKYGSHTPLKQLITLNKFVEEHKLPFGILINQSDRLEWLTPNIIQIPATYI